MCCALLSMRDASCDALSVAVTAKPHSCSVQTAKRPSGPPAPWTTTEGPDDGDGEAASPSSLPFLLALRSAISLTGTGVSSPSSTSAVQRVVHTKGKAAAW